MYSGKFYGEALVYPIMPGHCIIYAKRPAAATTDGNMESDCYHKMADLFERLGAADSAILYYRKSLMVDTAENVREN
ncbi:MAG: hypothetical protein IPN26_17655 [Bacteroidetes bacterium]|nr:hypothetical protein [Bacteroidota bacterium]